MNEKLSFNVSIILERKDDLTNFKRKKNRFFLILRLNPLGAPSRIPEGPPGALYCFFLFPSSKGIYQTCKTKTPTTMKQKHLITRVVFNYSATLGPQRGPNGDPRGSPRAPILCFLVFHILPLDIFQIRPVTSFFSHTFRHHEKNNVNYQVI